MRGAAALLSAALTCAFCAPAGADEGLSAGAYEVRYRLELPHVESRDEAAATICLSGRDAAPPVLSANNPLAHCPADHIRRDGAELSFDIACPGPNAAKAYALFAVRGERFEGRIAMNMGGKNMTMTEVQQGRRIGDCAAPVH
ncbi:DUF3617 domain-containing protein [Methylocella sp.]|uniref:DUF3617 domain-containing protein n=1 Tax=Methylocella sp. TaxID=1978226 RepID=UPI0035B3FDDC